MTDKKEKTIDKKSIFRIELSKDNIIQPNTVFPCPLSQVEWLTENGAITDVKRLTAADAMAAPAPVEEVVAEDDIPLDEMTDAALADVAAELGVKLTKRMKRATILKKITAAQATPLVADTDDIDALV